MSNTVMQHWNENQLCAIDTETTGLTPYYHEIVQICILPLTADIEVRNDVNPFYIEIIPEFPERADPKAMNINGLNFAKIGQRGHDKEAAKDLLTAWVDKLGLGYTKFGNRKKILPLGQNYAFDMSFLKAWLGASAYDDIFFYHYRDTMAAAGFMNDRAAMHAEKVPFNKINLSWLAKQYNVVHDRAHDALSDAVTTARVYKAMLKSGLLV